MPDTKVFPNPWSESTVMDQEIREAFRDLKDHLEEVHGRIFDLIREESHALHKCQLEHSTSGQKMSDDINGVGQRLNDHLKDHDAVKDKWWAVKLAAIGTAIAGVYEGVKWLVSRGGNVWLLALILCAGCGITEGAKGANSQNGHIGELVHDKGVNLADPALSQMGSDLVANAATVGNEIGAPEVDLPYSPENSKAARDKAAAALAAREEAKATLWQYATMAAGFLGLGSVVGWFRAALASSKLSTFASVATSVVEAVPDLKKKFAEKAKDKGVASIVDKVVQEHT